MLKEPWPPGSWDVPGTSADVPAATWGGANAVATCADDPPGAAWALDGA
jgi:hypothetical protein